MNKKMSIKRELQIAEIVNKAVEEQKKIDENLKHRWWYENGKD